jgi:hypothetical protein
MGIFPPGRGRPETRISQGGVSYPLLSIAVLREFSGLTIRCRSSRLITVIPDRLGKAVPSDRPLDRAMAGTAHGLVDPLIYLPLLGETSQHGHVSPNISLLGETYVATKHIDKSIG